MTTTDSNGLVQFTIEDSVTPLQSLLNLLSASVSDHIDSNVNTHNVPSISARNALASENPPTAEKPLLVWVQSPAGFWLNQGAGWEEWPPPPEEIPEVILPITHYADSTPFSSVNASSAANTTVTFGVTLDSTSNWVPQVTLFGPRGDVDRLQATVYTYTTTGMNVVIKNHTAKAAAGGTIYWSLLKKNPA